MTLPLTVPTFPPCNRCPECEGEDHHWAEEYVHHAAYNPQHPAAQAGHLYWEVCKHCDAWRLEPEDTWVLPPSVVAMAASLEALPETKDLYSEFIYLDGHRARMTEGKLLVDMETEENYPKVAIHRGVFARLQRLARTMSRRLESAAKRPWFEIHRVEGSGDDGPVVLEAQAGDAGLVAHIDVPTESNPPPCPGFELVEAVVSVTPLRGRVTLDARYLAYVAKLRLANPRSTISGVAEEISAIPITFEVRDPLAPVVAVWTDGGGRTTRVIIMPIKMGEGESC